MGKNGFMRHKTFSKKDQSDTLNQRWSFDPYTWSPALWSRIEMVLIFDLICRAQTMTHLRASRNLITRYFQITGLSRRLPTAAAATTYGRRSLHVGPCAPVGRSFKVDPCRWLGNGKIASKWSCPIVVPLAAHSKCPPSNQRSDPLPPTAQPTVRGGGNPYGRVLCLRCIPS